MNVIIGYNNKGLLVIDITSFYKIKDIFDALDKYGINRILIPGGLTPLLQPLNIYINKFIKYYLSKVYDEYIIEKYSNDRDFNI